MNESRSGKDLMDFGHDVGVGGSFVPPQAPLVFALGRRDDAINQVYDATQTAQVRWQVLQSHEDRGDNGFNQWFPVIGEAVPVKNVGT